MANNILSELFYGNLNPNEKRFDRDSEFGRAADSLIQAEDALRSTLTGDALERLESLLLRQGCMTQLTAEGYFTDGFRTGFRFALAVLYEEQKPPLKNG